MDMLKEFMENKRHEIRSPYVMDGVKREFAFKEVSGYKFSDSIGLAGLRVVIFTRGSKSFNFLFSFYELVFWCFDSSIEEEIPVTYNQFEKFCEVRNISEPVEISEEAAESSDSPEAVENIEEAAEMSEPSLPVENSSDLSLEEKLHKIFSFVLSIENTSTRYLDFRYDSVHRVIHVYVHSNSDHCVLEHLHTFSNKDNFYIFFNRLIEIKSEFDAERLSDRGYLNDSY